MLRIRSFSWKVWTVIVCLIVLAAGASIHRYSGARAMQSVVPCRTSDNKPLCYSDVIQGVLRVDGIPAAFDALALSYDTDSDFAGTCHAVTHELGKAAYDEFEKNGKTELSDKSSYCGYGFYHGFMDALYLETNDMEKARDFCSYVGAAMPHSSIARLAEGSCYHGIGHGVTDGTDPRVWGDVVAIVKPGLALCVKVAAGNTEWQKRCASGVFNALGNMYPDSKYKLDPGTNPYELCRSGPFSEVERESCYDQMNTQAAVLAHDDLRAIVGFTNTITVSDYRASALRSALSYYIQTLKFKQKSLLPAEAQVCDLPSEELKESCVSGFVDGIMEFGLPGQQYKEILQLCASEAFPRDFRHFCFLSLQANAEQYYTEDVIQRICADVPPKYRNAQCQS